MNKAIPLFFGLGILVGLALVVLGLFVWPMAAAQVQAAGALQAPAAQQPYGGCARHGMMNAVSPVQSAPADCPMHTGQYGAGECPMQGGAGACPLNAEGECPLNAEGECPLQGGVGECPMQGGAGECPMQAPAGLGNCPMESGSVK